MGILNRCSEIALCYKSLKKWKLPPPSKWRSPWTSGRYSEVVVNSGLTVPKTALEVLFVKALTLSPKTTEEKKHFQNIFWGSAAKI